ncbi:alpha/beta fold hydrolase [Amycolatopsis magusensis]|uniref:alpha/beta fold hydrolase n=1 Tax=Amycolatopsis magusensis TaxID=882444 RepID=UPI003798DF7C
MQTGRIATHVLGSGPPIVLTHGTPTSAHLWRHLAPTLAETHTVHLWDLPTYGDSEGENPTIAQHAATLAELVDQWDLERPTLIGHDIGGATVLRAHLLHGTPAARIALLDAAVLAPWVTPVAQHMQRYEQAYRTMPVHVFGEIVAAHLRTASVKPTEDVYLDHFAGEAGRDRYLDHVHGFSEDDTEPVVAKLAEIEVPVRVLWGAEDQWLSADTGRKLAEAIPGAEFTAVPGAGHFLPEDAPGELAALLRDWLSD